MRMAVTFDEIKYRMSKMGKCKCGKRLNRTRTFSQTINPWNKNKDGIPKNAIEINKELREEARNWKPEFVCRDCEAKE